MTGTAERPGVVGPQATAVLFTALPCGVVAATVFHVPLQAAAAGLLIGCGGGLCLVGLRRPGLGLLVLVAVALAAAGIARGLSVIARSSPPAGAAHFTGTVAEIDRSGLVVDAEQVVLAGDGAASATTVLVTTRIGGAAGIAAGDRVEVQSAALRRPGSRPGPRSAQSLDRLGVDAIASAATVTRLGVGSLPLHLLGELRTRIGAAVENAMPAPAAPLLLGIAFGWHGSLDPGVRASLQDAGLIHIVAVSGLKVVIVAAMVAGMLGRLPLSPLQRGAALTGMIVAYVVLSGAGPAAVRSGLTAALALVVGGDSRRIRPFAVLGLCATLMLAIDPRWLGDVGFQLSFLGTAGILLLAEPLGRRLPGPRLFVEPFAVTVAAQLATVPVMAGTFGTISLVGPVANALVLPLLPILIVLGWIGALSALALPLIGDLILLLAGIGVDVAVLVAQALDSIPGAAIHVADWPQAWTIAELAGVGVALLIWRAGHGASVSGATPT